MRRLNLAGDIDATHASEALRDLLALPITRYEHGALLAAAWDRQVDVTFYDGVYLALAEVLDAPVATTDARLARSEPTGVRIELVQAAG